MNTFLALNNTIAMLKEAINNELENIAQDQLSLENYKQRPNPNSLAIDARQSMLNKRYDNLDVLQQLINNLPDLINTREADIKAKAMQQASRIQCPVCFPPTEFYPYNSASEKEAVRARTIARQREADNI